KRADHSLLDDHSADVETVHAAAGDQVFAGAVITRGGVAAAIMNMQTAATVPASDEALQQRRAFSHRASRLMRLRTCVGIEPRLVGLKRSPIDEAGMMVRDEDCPLIHGKMPNAFPDGAVFIDIAFVASLAVRVSASIHRIGENVVERSISRRDPADRTRHTRRRRLQWKRQTFGAEPEPHAARRTELGETFEDRADGAGDRLIRMKQDLAILFSPDEAHRQSTAQLAACGFVADTAVESGANDMQLGFAHRTLEAKQQAIVEQRGVIDAVVVANESIGDATQFQQTIPVRIVPRQARNLQSENDAYVGQRHLAGEASEPGALVDARAG